MRFPSERLAQVAANNPQLRFTQEHGMTFSEIGDPGAAGTSGFVPGQPSVFDVVRSVEHRYRISTTEITTAQYFHFVEAVAPHVVALGGGGPSLAGRSLQYLGSSGGVPQYQMLPGTANYPARASYGYFAMMANWLHNGAPKVTEATIDDFRTGAYNDPVTQAAHNEGARFWIPTRDEWMKAVYYDPNRHGQGEGGYSEYTDASNDPLVPGRPEDGGETSAGNFNEWPPPKGYPDDSDNGRPQGVGLYPDVQTPWGLLDASGSASEWTETPWGTVFNPRRVEGSAAAFGLGDVGDSVLFDYIFGIGTSPGNFLISSDIGVRFAAAVPTPGVPVMLAFGALLAARRGR